MKNHIHPEVVTANNVARFKSQLKSLGLSFDWTREINTTDPSYYKWTQWIFLQLYKKGLAYKKEMSVNWCTSCKVVLANEEVVGGVCERCGGEVVHRVKSQWMLKITAYADRLIDDLEDLDFIDRVVTQQKNWIGRSHGAEVKFSTTASCSSTPPARTRCLARLIWSSRPSIPALKNGRTRSPTWTPCGNTRRPLRRRATSSAPSLQRTKQA